MEKEDEEAQHRFIASFNEGAVVRGSSKSSPARLGQYSDLI